MMKFSGALLALALLAAPAMAEEICVAPTERVEYFTKKYPDLTVETVEGKSAEALLNEARLFPALSTIPLFEEGDSLKIYRRTTHVLTVVDIIRKGCVLGYFFLQKDNLNKIMEKTAS